jgi:hypothetical protein
MFRIRLKHFLHNFIFCWPCILMQFWVMTNLMHSFLMCLFMPLHVSSSKCSSSGGRNCINTSSGITQSGGWLSDVPVLTGTSESHSPKCVIPDDVLIQFGLPDDEHFLLETCRDINTLRKSASSWSLPRISYIVKYYIYIHIYIYGRNYWC